MNLPIRHVWLLSLLVVWLSGCTGMVERLPAPLPVDRGVAWQQRQQRLDGVREWSLTGRIAVITEEQGWYATLQWRQRNGHYEIRLLGPFGQGGLRLEGDGSSMILDNGKQRVRYTQAQAEAHLARELGWPVPVHGLLYWVRGLPQPGGDADETLDERGRLERLDQAGWQIGFRRYMSIGGLEMPAKIVLDNPRYKVRLVVDSWSLGHAS
jgi:outer membrane lipoprotein LolB